MEILGKMEIITDHTLSDTIESDNLMLTEVQLQEIALRIYEYSLAKHTGYSYEDIIAVLRRNCEYYPPFPPISPFRNNPRTTRRRINYRAGERETLDMLIAVANYEAKQDDCRWANSIMADLNYGYYPTCPRFRQRKEDVLARIRRTDNQFRRKRRQRRTTRDVNTQDNGQHDPDRTYVPVLNDMVASF